MAIDPATTSGEDADETGIVVAGIDADYHGYVLADLSGRYPPHEWAAKAIGAYHRYKADCIVAEVNQGGEMVESVIRQVDPNVSFRSVHASRGKVTRAEPVAALYEQARIHHVGSLPTLEDQMCAFTADIDRKNVGSPDRVDALVWGVSLMIVENVPGAGLLRWYEDQNRQAGTVILTDAGDIYPPPPAAKPTLPMRAPPHWCGQIYGSTGKSYDPIAEQSVEVLEDDASAFRRLGVYAGDVTMSATTKKLQKAFASGDGEDLAKALTKHVAQLV